MAEPSAKKPRSALPFCPLHRHGCGLSKLARHNFPALVEEALCGVTSALLEASYLFQMLGEIFDHSDMAFPNVSKFFWDQAKEEREAAEALIQYQHYRGGLYCTKVIQRPTNILVNGVAAAMEVAQVQWKMLAGYFEELYALCIRNLDPLSASTIKKQFLASKIQKIKLSGDLITNAHRLRSAQDGRGDLENYFIDRLQKELKIRPDSELHLGFCISLQKCAQAGKELHLMPKEFQHHKNNIQPNSSGFHYAPFQPRWRGLQEPDGRQGPKWY